jgi:hypothetical protein
MHRKQYAFMEHSQFTEYCKVQSIEKESFFSIVIPKSFAIDLGLEKGDFVKMHTVENKNCC